MSNFFLSSYRKGLLIFSGTRVNIEYKRDSEDGLTTIRKFENGEFKNKTIHTKHPNIVYGIIKGKKSWGLWLNQWTDGIVDCTFTKYEIKEEFEKNGIKIPDSLWGDFENTLYKKRIKVILSSK